MLLYQVDAFTDAAFSGNPAAVCVLAVDRGDGWMQDVAMEMNLSETAFLRRQADGAYRLRWFTPTHEVDLCGHATLASAHVLWSEGFLAADETAHFKTSGGSLSAVREPAAAGADGPWITLDFPSAPVTRIDTPDGLLEGLGVTDPAFVGGSDRDLLVHLSSAEAVRTLEPDLQALRQLDARGVIVTAASDGGAADFVSRFFAPRVGVPEDPVTGSTHCALAPYWAQRTNKTQMVGLQLSRRGGTVRVSLDGPEADRVSLAGQAVTIFRARLDV